MAQKIIDLCKKTAELNYSIKYRQGSIVNLLGEGEIVITGDLHGHRRNFERIVAFADLEINPDRHVILQEIIHGGEQDLQGDCLSYRLLFDVVRYKLKFPDRVHLITGNHDTAFICNTEVMKDGKEMNRSMRAALDREFGADCGDVKLAMAQFLLSQPLAVKCDNRIWLSHSLPEDRFFNEFDTKIFERELEFDDMVRCQDVYLFTWGRNHPQQMLDKMAELLDVDIFILGHQAQAEGFCRAGENLIIIASDHNHGCLLPVDLTKSCNIEQLIDSIVPLASIY